MHASEAESTCRYRESCHFYAMAHKNDHSLNLKELYCVKWPEQCRIFQTRRTGGLVSITLWPTGKLSLGA